MGYAVFNSENVKSGKNYNTDTSKTYYIKYVNTEKTFFLKLHCNSLFCVFFSTSLYYDTVFNYTLI